MQSTIFTSNLHENSSGLSSSDSINTIHINPIDNFILCALIELCPLTPNIVDYAAKETNYQSTRLFASKEGWVKTITVRELSTLPADLSQSPRITTGQTATNSSYTLLLAAKDIDACLHESVAVICYIGIEAPSGKTHPWKEIVISDVHPILVDSKIKIFFQASWIEDAIERIRLSFEDNLELRLSKQVFSSLNSYYRTRRLIPSQKSNEVKKKNGLTGIIQSAYEQFLSPKKQLQIKNLWQKILPFTFSTSLESMKLSRFMQQYTLSNTRNYQNIGYRNQSQIYIGNPEITQKFAHLAEDILKRDKHTDAVAIVFTDNPTITYGDFIRNHAILEIARTGVLIGRHYLAPIIKEISELEAIEIIQFINYLARLKIIVITDDSYEVNLPIQSVINDFRRDILLCPVTWFIEPDDYPRLENLVKHIMKNGHIIFKDVNYHLPDRWIPCVHITSDDDNQKKFDTPSNALTIHITLYKDSQNKSWWKIKDTKSEWEFLVPIEDSLTLFSILSTLSRLRQWVAIQKHNPEANLKVSVVICTYQRLNFLDHSLKSITEQTMPLTDYEVIIVNNDIEDRRIYEFEKEWRVKYFRSNPDHFKIIDCPFIGISHARNAGISCSNGEVILYIDDDAIATPSLVDNIWNTYQFHNAGIVGGHIELDYEEKPPILRSGWEIYWSHLETNFKDFTETKDYWRLPWGANWSARQDVLYHMGGFRISYGRRGKSFDGGEDVLAGLIAQSLGYVVGIQPYAKVLHHIDPSRFTYEWIERRVLKSVEEMYIWQRDGYTPPDYNIRIVLQRILDPQVSPHIEDGKYFVKYYREGYIKVIRQLLRDTIYRRLLPYN